LIYSDIRTYVRFAMLASTIAACCAAAARAENWPGWRGPDRSGVSSERDLPLRWSATDGVLWKTPLPGQGISSPVIWDDAVVVTASDGKDLATLHFICLDRDTGRQRWQRKLWGTAPTLYHAQKSNMASPVPVTDGKHVYALFGTGDVFCVDMRGDLVWQRSLATEFGKFENRFGHTSSPLLYRDMVVLQCDHYGESYLLAVDQKTGATRWKADRPGVWHSWASPQLVPANGGHEMVVCAAYKVDGFDALSGKHLWTVGNMQRECIPSPVVAHGRVYAVSGPTGLSMAIRPGGRGDVTSTHVAWSNPRGAPFVPSPIVVGDYYYQIDDDGIATCLSAHSGERQWQKRFPGKYTASPIAGDGKIYFVNEAGDTLVIQVNLDRYAELARNAIGEPVFATPAISQGRLFLRGEKHLYCIGRR
jgi:outer membrane protein assembly factor BamB